jgi:hypothetical protein
VWIIRRRKKKTEQADNRIQCWIEKKFLTYERIPVGGRERERK